MLGALSAIHSCSQVLAGNRLLHFVDNQGALASLIHGFSSQDDCCSLACLYQLTAAEAGVRVWLEYVESEANLADGPSRFGGRWEYGDDAQAICCTMEEAYLPDLQCMLSAPHSVLAAFSKVIRDLPAVAPSAMPV